jgi:hypothetical protein
MASTYSSLKIELIGTGTQAGTWGDTTNTNLGIAIEEAITGSANVAFASADVTLTLADTNLTQTARNLRLNLTGTSGGARNLIVPAIEKQYIIYNGLADAVTVKNSTGTGVAIPAGYSAVVFNDATNVTSAVSYAPLFATGTLNKITFTPPATGATLTIADGKTFTASNSITIAGTDSKTLTVSNSITLAGNDSTVMTFPPASASLGYLNVPINSQSAAYTTVLTDAAKAILHPATDANPRTFTIDSNANVPYQLGTVLTFINMTTQVVTISITSDTMYLAGTGATGSRTLAQFGMATAVKLATTTWLISGSGIT